MNYNIIIIIEYLNNIFISEKLFLRINTGFGNVEPTLSFCGHTFVVIFVAH